MTAVAVTPIKMRPAINVTVISSVLRRALSIHVSEHYNSREPHFDFVDCQKPGCIEMRRAARNAYCMFLVDDNLMQLKQTLANQDLMRDRVRYLSPTGDISLDLIEY
jgi:hypothetical protein